MDLPSVEMALSHIDPPSDADLSDPPDELDDMDIDMEDDFMNLALTTPTKRKFISRSIVSDEDDESTYDHSDLDSPGPTPKKARFAPHVYSKFETIATEVNTRHSELHL